MSFQKQVITEAHWSSLNLTPTDVHPADVPLLPAQGVVDNENGSIFLRLKLHPLAARDGCETCIFVKDGTSIQIQVSIGNPLKAVWTVGRNFERQKVTGIALLAEAAVRCYYESNFRELEFSVNDRLAIRTDFELAQHFDLLASIYVSIAEYRRLNEHTARIKTEFGKSWLKGKIACWRGPDVIDLHGIALHVALAFFESEIVRIDRYEKNGGKGLSEAGRRVINTIRINALKGSPDWT